MKPILITTSLTLVSVATFAQGIVNFANASSVGWANPSFDRYVRWSPYAAQFNPGLTAGSPVASNSAGLNLTSLRAALYYAASTDYNLYDFVAASGGLATMRASTSATVGSWFGHYDTLDTIPNGTTANMVVFVWDTSVNADPLRAGAANAFFGESAIFQYTPPTNPLPQPSDFLMNGLAAFSVEIDFPEPSTFALAGLGAAALLIFRRGSYFN